MSELFNRRTQKNQRRELRGQMPPAEVLLWTVLKGRQLLGCKFRRQVSIGKYVVDFHCPALNLAIELDGDSHFQPGAKEYDADRTRFLESLGIRVVRVLNSDVYENLDGVWEAIAREVRARESLATRPLGRRGKRTTKSDPPSPP